MRRLGGTGHDLPEIAIVGEEMRAAAQLAHEGLRVGQAVAACVARRMCETSWRVGRVRRSMKSSHGLWARGLGLLVEPHLVTFMERHAPAVDVARIGPAVTRELAQREARAHRLATGQAEEFAHEGGR